MDKINKAKKFEREFQYGKGMIPTPDTWISYFWDEHRKKVVHYMNDSFKQARRILFVGFGSGDVVEYLDIQNKYILGIDLNSNFLAQVDKRGISLLAADGASMPVKSNSFDLVICNMVLHHIEGQAGLDNTIGECSRVLKGGGKLLLFEPNFFHPSGMILTLLNKFHLYQKVGGGSNYEYALSPFRLERLCRKKFKKSTTRAITFSHPRFPLFMQKLIFHNESHLNSLYPFGFSFFIEAVK